MILKPIGKGKGTHKPRIDESVAAVATLGRCNPFCLTAGRRSWTARGPPSPALIGPTGA